MYALNLQDNYSTAKSCSRKTKEKKATKIVSLVFQKEHSIQLKIDCSKLEKKLLPELCLIQTDWLACQNQSWLHTPHLCSVRAKAGCILYASVV